jgi:hypothetical protein
MAGYDDDEQRAAYDRAAEFARDNAAFHDIIQHYDDEARPDHDDIDYDPAGIDNLDGAEYDNDGDPVIPIGSVLIDIANTLYDICDAIDEFGSFDDIPDDYEFGSPEAGSHNSAIFLICDFEAERNYRAWCNRYKRPGSPGSPAGPDTPE